jgi:hypothetical protein
MMVWNCILFSVASEAKKQAYTSSVTAPVANNPYLPTLDIISPIMILDAADIYYST